MKKLLALLLALTMAVTLFAACGAEEVNDTDSAVETGVTETTPEETQSTESEPAESAASDLANIREKGTLVVGITEYEPINYLDENDEWTGFDTEFALLIGEKLGVKVEFKEIDWDNKWIELNSGNIDCVWNGMTITEEAKTNALVSIPYVINAQVIVTKAANAEKYADAAGLADAVVAAESGSAGMEAGVEAALNMAEYPLQSDAVIAVESGKADACIIDITMANAMTGEGTSYADLTYTGSLTEEEYGIAFRKDSDLCAEVNSLIKALMEEGTLGQLAEKYALTLAAAE